MQEHFLDKAVAEERERMIRSQDMVLSTCASRDVPVLVLEYGGEGDTIAMLRARISQVPRHRYLQKWHSNGFYQTSAKLQLQIWGVERVLLMGISASHCVQATAEGARKDGFRTITAAQLIADGQQSQRYAKSEAWYRRNGLWFNDYRECLPLLVKKHRPPYPQAAR